MRRQQLAGLRTHLPLSRVEAPGMDAIMRIYPAFSHTSTTGFGDARYGRRRPLAGTVSRGRLLYYGIP